jgi:predicted TPR repeat methyltransferase
MSKRSSKPRKRQKPVKLLTINPADIEKAVSCHRAGKLDKAERIYRRVLASDPNHVDALHFMGVLHHQCGRSHKASECIGKAIALQPDYVDAHNNLGNVLKETGRLDAAVRAYRRVVELVPTHADAWSNLGVVLRGQGSYDEALAAYAKAIEADTDHVIAWQNRGNLLAKLDRLDEAVAAYLKVLELQPHDTYAYDLLGKTLYRAGRVEEAVGVYRKWLAADPDNSVARHMLAACTGDAAPERAPDRYVRDIFDGFAGSFDQVLDRLHYRAPRLIAGVLDRYYATPDADMDVVDAGCGTGLCGDFLRPLARRLTGVDLSPGMLAKARGRGLYDQLFEAELTAWLAMRTDNCDLIVSADTLVYFGELVPVLTASCGAMRPGGLLVFTLEETDTTGSDSGYRLDPSGRYCHTEEYVTSALAQAGLQSEGIDRVVLRQERAQDVAGMLVTARKLKSN